jgi:hypothetical protein
MVPPAPETIAFLPWPEGRGLAPKRDGQAVGRGHILDANWLTIRSPGKKRRTGLDERRARRAGACPQRIEEVHMPFDGKGYENRADVADKIGRVIDLLAHEDRWCKKQLRTKDGRRCIVGAIEDMDARKELANPILNAIREVTGRTYVRIESFNDDPMTTHALVVRVLRRAQDGILAGGSGPTTVLTPVRERPLSSWLAPLTMLVSACRRSS